MGFCKLAPHKRKVFIKAAYEAIVRCIQADSEVDKKVCSAAEKNPAERRCGQRLLNEFVETLALDLPRFMERSPKEKADVLLRIIGVEGQLRKLNRGESAPFNRRSESSRVDSRKQECASEQPLYPDVLGGTIQSPPGFARLPKPISRAMLPGELDYIKRNSTRGKETDSQTAPAGSDCAAVGAKIGYSFGGRLGLRLILSDMKKPGFAGLLHARLYCK